MTASHALGQILRTLPHRSRRKWQDSRCPDSCRLPSNWCGAAWPISRAIALQR